MSSSRSSRIGSDKERLACAYLQAQGLCLVARNYRCRRGEIDLIMRDTDTLVFVEVRYRASSHFGAPAETVDVHKQKRLVAAAASYLQQHPNKGPCRFDVVGLSGRGQIDWIRSAFDVE